MRIATMGKVVVLAKIENLGDLYEVKQRTRQPDEIRTIEVADAIVDTGATLLSLPARLITQLGLRRVRTRRAKTPAGLLEFSVYEPVRLSIQGRDCTIETAEVPDDCRCSSARFRLNYWIGSWIPLLSA